MIAINCLDKKKYEIKKADKYIKQLVENACYYFSFEKGILILFPSNIEEIDEGHLFMNFEVNGIIYESVFTNSYKELIIFYKIKNKVLEYKQMTLFDIKGG